MIGVIKDVFEKLTKYERYVVLLPGVFFIALCQRLQLMDFSSCSLTEKMIAVFFSGLVCSRVGAFVVEGIVKVRRLRLWSEYEDYLIFREKDQKQASMIALNCNWFRSLSGMAIALFILQIGELCEIHFGIGAAGKRLWFMLGLIVLFFGSYVRQVLFMKHRIAYFKSKRNSQGA